MVDTLDGVNFTDLITNQLSEHYFQPSLKVISDDYGGSPLLQTTLWQSAADTLVALGLPPHAMEAQGKATEQRRRLLGPDHALTLESEAHAESVAINRDVAARLAVVYGRDHPELITVKQNIGTALFKLGRLADAEPYFKSAIDRGIISTGAESTLVIGSKYNMARLLQEQGRFDEAINLFQDIIAVRLRYSYVLNNPLSATDPTGNFSLRQALAIVVAVVAVIFQQYWALQGIAAFGAVAAAGFVSGAIATGTLKGALWGAVSAAVFFGIGSYFQNVAGINAEAVRNGGKAMNLMKSGQTSGQTLAKIAAHAGSPCGSINPTPRPA